MTSFELLRPLPVPDGAFTAVAAGGSHACGIRPDASIACWSYQECGPTNLPSLSPTPPQPNTLSPIVFASGSLEEVSYALVSVPAPCNTDGGVLEPPDGRFTAISAGSGYSCGLEETGTIRCWGGWFSGFEPPGQFRSVAIGTGNYTCAVRTDDTIHCSDGGSSHASERSGRFRSVAVADGHPCAIRTDDTILCWRNNTKWQPSAPSGEFASITGGETHFCGLRPNGAVECWGSFGDEPNTPHSPFADVSAGGRYTCGVRTNGTLECWDLHARTLADVPDNVAWPARA